MTKLTDEETCAAFKDMVLDEFNTLSKEFGYGKPVKLTADQIITLIGVGALSVIARVLLADWNAKQDWLRDFAGVRAGDTNDDVLDRIFGGGLKKKGEG